MLFMLFLVVLAGYPSLAKPSLNELPVHPGVGGLYKGPNSETIIKGPDGSVITAQQEGGSIITQDTSQPIVVADTLEVDTLQQVDPVVSAVSVPPGPAVAAAPVAIHQAAVALSAEPAVVAVPVAAVPVGHTIEVIQPDPHIIETEIVDAPVVEPQQSSDLIGPSGNISTRGSSSIVSGPASTTISEPAKIVIATPLVAAIPVVATVTTPLRAVPVVNSAVATAAGLSNPVISTATVAPPIDHSSPRILVSPPVNVIPNAISTLALPIGVISTTVAPPQVWEDNDIDTVSTPASGLIINPQATLNQIGSANIGASVQPSSSYGFVNNLNNAVQVSSTPRPEGVLSSTPPPPLQGVRITTPARDLDLINNGQLNINPSLIPSANIIPPEIGPLPPGAIDLGTTVTVSTTPRAPGIVSTTESQNIQRISSENSVLLNNNNLRNINGKLAGLQATPVDSTVDQFGSNQVSAQNRIIFSGNGQPVVPTPLLRDTSPIPVGIPRNGIVGSQLANYGIDSSQIDLTNVPLSSVSGLPQTIDQEIDDVSAQLWNRYGRDVKEKKVKEKKNKGDNK